MDNNRAFKKENIKLFQKLHDMELLESTERCQNEPVFFEDGTMMLPQVKKTANDHPGRRLFKSRRCYVCKDRYFDVHHFYHQLCPTCANMNYAKRSETCDLEGRIALVTGGRIKIGYEISLKLLRSGATVLVTTRFKRDAASRYAKEADYSQWKDRLMIYGLDLRHIPSVESFIEHLTKKGQPIDIIINNAAQTIRKPDTYYQEMAMREQKNLSTDESKLIGNFSNSQPDNKNKHHLHLTQEGEELLDIKTDEFNEPLDLRKTNSWLATLESVETIEYLETQIVNAMAPFLLNSRLKPLMVKSPFKQRFIINVSAMEGQFNRINKTHRHPHTNMAKAALNMMTRTSAQDYVNDGIYMNSVDTGWVTEENPFPVKVRNRVKGAVPPLDCIDGASRVVALIFDTIKGEEPVFGKFLKDYKETQW